MNQFRITVALLISSTIQTSLSADDWTQFGGPNRNFTVVEGDSPIRSEGPVTSWSFPTLDGDDAPVVADGRVVCCEADYTENGTDAYAVVCRELSTGNPLWRRIYPENSFVSQDISGRYPVRPLATCCVVGNRIFVVGFGGSVRCLSLDSGDVQWSHDLVNEFDAIPIQYGAATSPWSDGKVCVVACGGERALLIAFSIEDGQVVWTAGTGPASYASLVTLNVPSMNAQQPAQQHLVYAAGNELIGVDPKDGTVQWRYPYPNQGLTNAVTPLVIEPGKLLVGGQGFEGSSLLRIEAQSEGGFALREAWCNRKFNPFYCNWTYLHSQKLIVGFAGKLLHGIDCETGATLWQIRGWTDANISMLGDEGVIVRGDGVLARTKITRSGIEIMAASRVTSDRVWAPPTLVGQRILVRGRASLSCVAIDSIPPTSEIPNGTNVTAMDAMYGNANERISALINAAKSTTDPLRWEDYAIVAADASISIGDAECIALLKGLEERGEDELASRISDDWCRRQPYSIPAWQNRTRLLEKSGRLAAAREAESERFVRIAFEVTVPESTPSGAQIYIAGNADGLGNWQPDQFQLMREIDGKYRGVTTVPRGDLQFKVTLGSWDSSEVRADQRSISNRRLRVMDPSTHAIEVQAWKVPSREPE